MTTRGTESMAWDGIVVQCGEVHVETSASWAGRRDLKGEALQAVSVGTLCGAEPLVRNNRLLDISHEQLLWTFMLVSYAKWYSFTPPHWPNFPPPLT